MLPIILKSDLRVGLVAAGLGLKRRREMLEKADLTNLQVFEGRFPSEEEISLFDVLFVAGLDEARSRDLAEAARRREVLVNVEDVPELCDFHVPAQIRRGELLFTISTGGQAPGLSRILREKVERSFGGEWEDRIGEISQLRTKWRAEGIGLEEVSKRIRSLVIERGWLE